MFGAATLTKYIRVVANMFVFMLRAAGDARLVAPDEREAASEPFIIPCDVARTVVGAAEACARAGLTSAAENVRERLLAVRTAFRALWQRHFVRGADAFVMNLNAMHAFIAFYCADVGGAEGDDVDWLHPSAVSQAGAALMYASDAWVFSELCWGALERANGLSAACSRSERPDSNELIEDSGDLAIFDFDEDGDGEEATDSTEAAAMGEGAETAGERFAVRVKTTQPCSRRALRNPRAILDYADSLSGRRGRDTPFSRLRAMMAVSRTVLRMPRFDDFSWVDDKETVLTAFGNTVSLSTLGETFCKIVDGAQETINGLLLGIPASNFAYLDPRRLAGRRQHRPDLQASRVDGVGGLLEEHAITDHDAASIADRMVEKGLLSVGPDGAPVISNEPLVLAWARGYAELSKHLHVALMLATPPPRVSDLLRTKIRGNGREPSTVWIVSGEGSIGIGHVYRKGRSATGRSDVRTRVCPPGHFSWQIVMMISVLRSAYRCVGPFTVIAQT